MEDDLLRLAAAYRGAETRTDAARAALYAAIRAARRDGASLRTLARITGLSHNRIAQIDKES